MSLKLETLHPHFCAVVLGVTLADLVDEATLQDIRQAMDRHAVLVFREQPLTGEQQVAFAQRLDGALHTMTTLNVLADGRSTSPALTEISNAGERGAVLAAADRRRMSSLGNRLWHTDASFVDPAGRYSMLSAKVLPPVDANTEFACTRSAYDALSEDMKQRIDGLRVHHSITYSRGLLGFEFTAQEHVRLLGAEHPLVRTLPGSGRRSLYLASHASHIVGWPIADGRLLLGQLMEHATQRHFVYSHVWRPHDFVIWDNRATMHRAMPFDDRRFVRELRRATTLDLPPSKASGALQ